MGSARLVAYICEGRDIYRFLVENSEGKKTTWETYAYLENQI
jgi:hypothetical protein